MVSATSRGVLCMLGANVVFCAMACLVRSLAGINTWTATLFRFLIGIGIICLCAMSGKIKLNFVNNRGLFVRGLVGGVSTAIFFYSITSLGLIRAGFIASLYPVFAVLFGYVLLKEHISPVKCVALAGAFVGVIFLMKRPSMSGSLMPYFGFKELFALSGSMLAGLTVISIKKLQVTDSTVAIFFAQCLIGACIVFVPASVYKGTISPGALLVLVAIGLLATAGQLLSTSSYRYLTVSTGSLLIMTAPVINCVAGVLIFHESITMQSAVGACIILVSLGGLFFDKYR